MRFLFCSLCLLCIAGFAAADPAAHVAVAVEIEKLHAPKLAVTVAADPFADSQALAKPACPCTCGCFETGVCTCNPARQQQMPQSPLRYAQVCENGVCRMVPVQEGQMASCASCASPGAYYGPGMGGCGSGGCSPRRGLFGRFRRR